MLDDWWVFQIIFILSSLYSNSARNRIVGSRVDIEYVTIDQLGQALAQSSRRVSKLLFLWGNLRKAYRKLMWLVELGYHVWLHLLKKIEKFSPPKIVTEVCWANLIRRLPISPSNLDRLLLMECNNERCLHQKAFSTP